MSQDEPDDEEARRAKAARLRERIAHLKSSSTEAAHESDEHETEVEREETPAEESREQSHEHESPREFIHRRMRELDEDKKEQ
jgi:hypothetical protein